MAWTILETRYWLTDAIHVKGENLIKSYHERVAIQIPMNVDEMKKPRIFIIMEGCHWQIAKSFDQ